MNTDTYTYSNGDWGDQLVSFNGQTITYDQMGNPTTYLGATLSWENIRQLASYVKGNTNVSYTYNVDGIRTSKTVNGVTHTYALEGTRILLETYGTVLIVYLYDEAGSPIGLAYRDSATADTTLDKEEQFTYYLFTKNLQGDIISIYNEQGQIVTLYRYDAWGNHTVHNWTDDNVGNINPFRYRGYYYDTDTGFYYLNSRYYDPQVKRFINADEYAATGQGFTGNNMFVYCGNNPVMFVDKNGNLISSPAVLGGIVGIGLIVIALFCVAITVYPTNDRADDSFGIGFGDDTTIRVPTFEIPKAEETPKVENPSIAVPETNTGKDDSVIFPINPNEFNPNGLVRIVRPGTKNGVIVSWMDLGKNMEVFRWDENINFPNGPHYHIYGKGHYEPGIDFVPEPYASIYFPSN